MEEVTRQNDQVLQSKPLVLIGLVQEAAHYGLMQATRLRSIIFSFVEPMHNLRDGDTTS